MTNSPSSESTGDLLTFPGINAEVRVHCFDSKDAAGAYVAAMIAGALQGAVAERGKALWIGCGGTTPKPIYERLVQLDLEWGRIILTQVDERFVPTDDAASNTLMMHDALAPILDDANRDGMAFISLIQDLSDPATCAAKAEARLFELGGGEAPEFDIALMGMGPDAHYASIFPGHPINAFIYDTKALVVPVKAAHNGSEPVLPRITLSVPALNRSRRIIFFITGQIKLDVLKTAALSADPYTSPVGAFLAQCPVPVDFVWAA